MDILTASYDFGYSEEVRQLQELLGIRADGYYLRYTRAKHLEARDELLDEGAGVPPTTTTTTQAPPAATFSEEVNGDVSVICGADGLAVEYWLDGNLIDPETGGLRFTQGAQSFHRVVGAEDGEDTDYLFDGGWWVEDRTDGVSCEPYEGPNWEDFTDDSILVTEIIWADTELRDILCPQLLPAPIGVGDCVVDFDYVRRATVDGHRLEIGFDCTEAGVGEAWWVLDSVMVANRYYHPPEFAFEDYEEWVLAPMRDLYGDSVYDYVAHVEWVDGEAFLFDIGRVGIDLSLEAFLGRDNCVLLDWSIQPVAFEGATPGQLVWQTGWMVDAGLLGPECAGYSTCRKEISYWEASGADIGLQFSLTSKPITPVVLDITWDPTEVSIGDAAGGCADTSQVDTSATLRVTIEPDDWPHQGGNTPPAGMLTFATSGAGDGIADGDQVTEIRVTVVDELSDPAYHDAEDLVLQVTTRDDPDGAICH